MSALLISAISPLLDKFNETQVSQTMSTKGPLLKAVLLPSLVPAARPANLLKHLSTETNTNFTQMGVRLMVTHPLPANFPVKMSRFLWMGENGSFVSTYEIPGRPFIKVLPLKPAEIGTAGSLSRTLAEACLSKEYGWKTAYHEPEIRTDPLFYMGNIITHLILD